MNVLKKLNRFDGALIALTLAAVALFSFYPPGISHADQARVQVYSAAYNATALDLSDAAGATIVVNAPGAVLGDACIGSISADAVDATISCYIQAAGKAEIRFQNESGTSTDLAAGTARAFVFPKGTR